MSVMMMMSSLAQMDGPGIIAGVDGCTMKVVRWDGMGLFVGATLRVPPLDIIFWTVDGGGKGDGMAWHCCWH